MNAEQQFSILVLDDDMCLTTFVRKMLHTTLPEAEVLTARSVAEAQLLLSEFKIHFFILDVYLPDGTGIDFLCDVRTLFPDAHAIIITSAPTPELETHAKELGAAFYAKPVDKTEIIKLIRAHHKKLGFGADESHPDGQFAVSMVCPSALEVIQMKCISTATLVLQVESSSGRGRIYIDKGQIVHAETPRNTGERAFEEILCWSGGKIEELPVTKKPPRTINMNWQGLVLNICQRIDENSHVHGAPPVSIPHLT
jgi:ActR/RegA family two-component response regulator